MLQQAIIFCRLSGRITNLGIYVVIKVFHCVIGMVLNIAWQYLMYVLSSVFWVVLLFLVFRWQVRETHKALTEIKVPKHFSGSLSVSLVHSDVGKGGLFPGWKDFSVHVLVPTSLHWELCLMISEIGGQSLALLEVEGKFSPTAGRKWSVTICVPGQMAEAYITINTFGYQNRISQRLYLTEQWH